MNKKKIFLLLILLIFIFSISSVNAEYNLTVTNNEITTIEDETGTFEDLTLELDAIDDGGTYNLTKNYKYESGSNEGIKINKSITINGENHRLDGNSQSRIFTTFEGNITFNNLVLVNGFADEGGAILAHNVIACNNVTFINNHAKNGGAIYMHIDGQGEDIPPINITYCTFDGNYADDGASIFIQSLLNTDSYENISDDDYMDDVDGNDTQSNETISDDDYMDDVDGNDEVIIPFNVIITNSVFKNSHNFSKGLIFINIPIAMNICNSTFANSTSEYGTAVFTPVGCILKTYNNLYINLNSIRSGGGICGLAVSDLVIDNSTFTNVSAQNNGGAICFDINGGDLKEPFGGTVLINNSQFKNSKAKFGGSIVLFGGDLYIFNSSFENNSAFSGAAIYVATTNMIIGNSTFKNNEIDNKGNGGAINEFKGKLKIEYSRFMDNTKNAIYCSDSEYNISNCYFNNNGEAIHSIYVVSQFTNDNIYTNDVLAENTTDDNYYILVINSTGAKLNLINNDINVVNLPVRYDSRDFGWITPVKDQSYSGACWVFSTCAVLEAALLKSTGIEYNLSINNIQKNLIGYSKYGHIQTAEGGFISMASKFILSWYGAFRADYEPFDIVGKITIPVIKDDAIHVQDFLCLPPINNATDHDAIKRAIMKYGAIGTNINIDYCEPNYNNKTSALYNNITCDSTNHAICVVGWDDNYPASNFLITPPGNGAWIIKDSFGLSKDDNGYMYVSYYDGEIFRTNDNIAFIFENAENYNKNYQTDIGGEITLLTDNAKYIYKNTYKAIGNDFISAVGTFFESKEEYNLKIYVNGQLKHTQNGISPFNGYHTVKLTKNIPVKIGDTFMVVASKSSMPFVNYTVQHFPKGTSFADFGEGWVDLSMLNATATLKVYTKPLINLTPTINTYNVNTVYNGGKYLTVNVKDVYGVNLAGVKVTVKLSNGVMKTLKTDSKGQIKLLVSNMVPKTYKAIITTASFGKYIKATAIAKIVVKKANSKLVAINKIYKRSVKIKKYTITLKSNNGKAIVKAKVVLKVNGKIYASFTNSKGIATFKITNLIKKGNFKAILTFNGNKYYNKVSKMSLICIK